MSSPGVLAIASIARGCTILFRDGICLEVHEDACGWAGCTILTTRSLRRSADEFWRWPEEQHQCGDGREERRRAEGSGSPARNPQCARDDPRDQRRDPDRNIVDRKRRAA